MCGISVIITSEDRLIPNELIKASTDIIYHRGPDSEGFYFGSNFAFGHRRLSIIDLSVDGIQPMCFSDIVITYNGEIYNYIELREELKSAGFIFKTETDTEVIIYAYKYWGYDCQNKFIGMWAFCLYDSIKNIIFCSRDRFCQKPFVYMKCGSNFLIGSEIKQFSIHPEFNPKLNYDSVFDFLEHGLLNHTNLTFFCDVFSLDGGHQLIYDLSKHSFEITRWYEPKLDEQLIDFKTAKEVYLNLLLDSLSIQLRSDVNLGVALSGGLDSSGLVCLTKQIDKNGQYKAITSCYSNQKYDESFYAECVAKHSGAILHKTFPNLDELITQNYLEKMIWHQEQPILGLSHFSEFSVFKEARNQGISVMICGQGPDEHTAGYTNFFAYYNLSLVRQLKFLRVIQNLAATNFYISFKKFLCFLFLNNQKKENNFINYKSFQKEPSKINLGIFSSIDNIRSLSKKLIFKTSIPYQAHSEDRNSMCFSIESRSPYLDHRLLELAVRLPDEFKIYKNYNKYVLREVLQPFLPVEVYERKDKMGFEAPDHIWLKERSHLVRPILEESCNYLKKVINGEFILKHFDEYIRNQNNYSSIYIKVISLAQLCKIYEIRI